MVMADLLCLAAYCRALGVHATDCTVTDCRGCVPRRAADGLRLCGYHTERIGLDAVRAAELHAECVLALAGGSGEPVRGGIPGGISLSDAATTARTEIRHTLVSWTLLIGEERGLSLPPDGMWHLGQYVAKHSQWLAAHGAAGDAVDELANLVGLGRRAAYPDGARVIHIGSCPEVVEDEPCGGKIRALLRRADSLLPSEVVCNRVETHAWTGDRWRTLGRQMETKRAA